MKNTKCGLRNLRGKKLSLALKFSLCHRYSKDKKPLNNNVLRLNFVKSFANFKAILPLNLRFNRHDDKKSKSCDDSNKPQISQSVLQHKS